MNARLTFGILATDASGKLSLRTALMLTAIVWGAHLSVILASALSLGTSGALPYQLGRIAIATLGFSLSILIHLAASPGEEGAYGRQFLRVLALCAPAAFIVTVYARFQFDWAAPPDAPPPTPFWEDIAFSIAYYLWIFISWAALYVGVHAMRDSQTRARQLAEIEAQAHLSQLSALRYQLNPHFFFNALNTLSGLISARRLSEAEEVIIRMADFLRYSLRGGPAEFVPLEEELNAQRAYLEIEKVRFGDRISVAFDIPPTCVSASVPALILQPLVENAVKHGVARSESPVAISIGARRDRDQLFCWVENTALADGADAAQGLGVGLRNVEARLNTIFGAAAELQVGHTTANGWRSTIRLPMREFQPCAS